MDIGGWIVIILLVICSLTGIFYLADYIYSFFAKRRLKSFLQKANQDLTFRVLLEKISSFKIDLTPFGLFSEFLLDRNTSMKSNILFMQIAISNRMIKRFLGGEQWGLTLLILAHEFGHFRQFFPILVKNPSLIPSSSLWKLLQGVKVLNKAIIKEDCPIKERNCLYKEILASRIGIGVLEKNTGKKIREIVSENDLNWSKLTTLEQCKRCIDFLIQSENAKRCPRFKALKKMGVNIEDKRISIKAHF